jgi:hypothetical protein
MVGKPEEFTAELEKIRQLSKADIEESFRKIIQVNKSNTLVYKSINQ